MDDKILQQLGASHNGMDQQVVLQYFEHFKQLDNGWQLSLNALINRTYIHNDQAYFFLLQVMEHHLKTRYQNATGDETSYIRSFLLGWLESLSTSSEKRVFIINKFSQLFLLAFLSDYPSRWPTFFTDLLSTLKLNLREHASHAAVDIFFRVLMSIHDEVVDRDIPHTNQELKRNTYIKDFMREQCVQILVSSWHDFLILYESLLLSVPTAPQIIRACLETVGAYISWIDISLIANDRFISIILRLMGGQGPNGPRSFPAVVRGEACECLSKVVAKGMEPLMKVKLVESIASVLEEYGLMRVPEGDDDEYVLKFAGLVSNFGNQLVQCWQKFIKDKDHKNAKITFDAIQSKLPLLLKLFADDDDDISQSVIVFLSGYIGLMKQLPLSNERTDFLKNVLSILIKKVKYDDSYNFGDESDDEADFQEYRKELKIIYINLSSLDCDMFMEIVNEVYTTALQKIMYLKFSEVEAALYFLFLLGEVVPISTQSSKSSKIPERRFAILQEMIKTMLISNVSCYPHPAVQMQFFETVVRYEKFFGTSPEFIPEVLKAFLDERGLWSPHCHVRSRASYLFSRFVKSINKVHIHEYLEMVLARLQGLLVLNTANVPMPQKKLQPLVTATKHTVDTTSYHLTVDDQQFMFETASILIIQSSFPPEKKRTLMSNLVLPILGQFSEIMLRLVSEQDENVQSYLAQLLNYAMSFISRTSKGFSGHQTVHANGCVDIFVEAMSVFIKVLKVPVQQQTLHQGFRQFLHRMVICLDKDILQFTPAAVEGLMTSASIKQLHDFIPFLNQLIQKFKKLIIQYMHQVFIPVVSIIQTALNVPIDENDQVSSMDKKMLRRGYFGFISIIINNDTSEILSSQNSGSLVVVLDTLIQGAADCSDPSAQKICFGVLRKMVELWDGTGAIPGFQEFIYEKIVPCCFVTPVQRSFDLNDAVTILTLNEVANCIKKVFEKQGKDFIQFLTFSYFPQLNIPAISTEDFCRNLSQTDEKCFQNYSKAFFTQLRLVHS